MKKLSAIMALIITALLCSCGVNEAKGELYAMDTYMSFKLYGEGGAEALPQIKTIVTEYDGKLSATDENSEIYRLNAEGEASLSPDALRILNRSLELCAELKPALDITVYPIVREWGFVGGDYKIPDEKTLAQLSTKVDYKSVKVDGDTVTLGESAQIDLGAVAKGFLADESKPILAENNINSALLNFGGTILAYGKKPDGTSWKVGIANPENSSDYFGYLSCEDKVVATSGGYERYFVGEDGARYIHIINPATGYPVDNGVSSVTVISSDGTVADAMSTALYVMGVDKAIDYYKTSEKDFDFIILCGDGRLYISDAIAADFTLKDGYEAKITVV